MPILSITRAVDHYRDDLIRRDYAARTIDSYVRILDKFCDRFPRDTDVGEIREADCFAFLSNWNHTEPNTRHGVDQALRGFTRWLYLGRRIKREPMEFIERPRRRHAADLNVTTISTGEVEKLLDEAENGKPRPGQTRPWTDILSVAIPAYLGPRRHAVAMLRIGDYDRDGKRLRFYEKGRKVIWKPAPAELVELLEEAIADGAIWPAPHDYLIPPLAEPRRKGDRDDRVVWAAVRRVAKRAGVKTHVHALRAAFAVFYLESHHGDTEALQALLGHESLATTEQYLRRLDRNVAMERVRDLSYGRGEIRTRGAVLPAQPLSRRLLSATQAPVPETPQIPTFWMASLLVAIGQGRQPSIDASPVVERDSSQLGGTDLPEALRQAIPQPDRDRV